MNPTRLDTTQELLWLKTRLNTKNLHVETSKNELGAIKQKNHRPTKEIRSPEIWTKKTSNQKNPSNSRQKIRH